MYYMTADSSSHVTTILQLSSFFDISSDKNKDLGLRYLNKKSPNLIEDWRKKSGYKH